MKTTLTKIGNSKGVILPAHLLKACQLDNVVSIDMKDDAGAPIIVISKPKQPRSGWKEAFAKSGSQNQATQEMLIDDSLPNAFDEEEWTW